MRVDEKCKAGDVGQVCNHRGCRSCTAHESQTKRSPTMPIKDLILENSYWDIILISSSSFSSCDWASSSDGLDVDGVDFKPASNVIIQDQQTLYSFWS